MSEPKVTARWTAGEHGMEAPVVNPGDWFGKTWLLSLCVSSAEDLHYIVEADNMADAIDTLAEDERYGHAIAIDVEAEGDDYGEPLSNGIELTEEQEAKADKAVTRHGLPRDVLWLTLKGNFVPGNCLAEPQMSSNGIWYDMDNLEVHGREGIPNGKGMPFPVTYHAPGFPDEGISPLDYDDWDWDEEDERFRELCSDCRTRLENGVCPECSNEDDFEASKDRQHVPIGAEDDDD